VHVISGLVHFSESRARNVPALPAAGADPLTREKLEALMAKTGVATPQSRLTINPQEAARAAAEIGFPVAVKIVSPQASHKTEVGGVALDLNTPAAVAEAAERMRTQLLRSQPDAEISGFLVQQMVAGLEVIAGFRDDPGFGPYLLLGLGGIYVEALKDIACSMLPVGGDDIVRMIANLRSAALFGPFRGQPPRDVAALAKAIQALADIFLRHRNSISDLEVNPIMIGFMGEGARAVDIRLVAREPRGS
jgi:succinyl-CoA synthetase beta subunit